MVVAAFIAATLTTVAQPTSADQITDQIHNDQQQQAQVQAELATLRAKIAAAQNQEGELTAIISGLDAQIAATQARVTQSLAQVAAIGVELTAARSRLDVSRARLAMEKEQLAGELVTIYELANESTPLSNLLASGDFNQFWTDLIDSRRISDHELQTVDVIHAQQDQIQAEVDQIGAEQAGQQAALNVLYETRQTLDEQRATQQTALLYLGRLQAEDLLREQQMQAANQALSAQIALLQAEEQQALAAGGGSGHFVWPDTGPISQGFGCTSYPFEPYDPACPQKHFHYGIDIAGPCGNHILAADAGIAHIEPYQSFGYGNYIVIVHGNGWVSLYGHLAGFAIQDGQVVGRGQLIGYEGSSGNSTGCHLHFGVNLNNQWVNPLAYLP